MSYIVNGKTQVGWRIDKLADSEDDTQTLGMDWLKSYVAFVREKPVADQIVALLNEAEDTSLPAQPAPTDDQKALRAAALEEALRCLLSIYIVKQRANDPACRGLLESLISEAIPNAFKAAGYEHPESGMVRALAGSPAQQGQLTKENIK